MRQVTKANQVKVGDMVLRTRTNPDSRVYGEVTKVEGDTVEFRGEGYGPEARTKFNAKIMRKARWLEPSRAKLFIV